MKILDEVITLDNLKDVSSIGEEHTYFDDMVKCVVDIEKETIAVNAGMHADLETFMPKTDL